MLHEGQGHGDDDHGGDQEQIPSEQRQTECRGGYADDGGLVVIGAEPLLHENGDEQGSQGKVDALEVERQHRAGDTAYHGADDPVDLIEEGHQKAVAVAADTVGHLVLGDQGVGLVGEGEDHVGLFLAGALVGIYHRDAVKQMPGIDQQGGHSSGKKPGTAGKQTDGQILHGTGINEQTHSQRPENTVAALVQHDAKPEAKEQIPGHHRNRIQKRGPDSAFFHKDPSDFGKCDIV